MGILILAEEKGFEPLHPVTGLRDFESRLFDHLSTPPYSERAYYNSESLENQVFFNEKQYWLLITKIVSLHFRQQVYRIELVGFSW